MVSKTTITVQATVQAPIEKVWQCWTEPAHIMQWNNASDDWHTPHAENDLHVGGRFTSSMAARDGSMAFDFGGTYTQVAKHQHIAYTMDDGRQVDIAFSATQAGIHIVERFEAEGTNSIELQQNGWQAILNNFKKHVENE